MSLPAALQGGVGEVFYFDYGVLAMWGLMEKQERDVIRNIVTPCMLDPLPQVGWHRLLLGRAGWGGARGGGVKVKYPR